MGPNTEQPNIFIVLESNSRDAITFTLKKIRNMFRVRIGLANVSTGS